jgi:tetratricopeptide (TPR) repeat protein
MLRWRLKTGKAVRAISLLIAVAAIVSAADPIARGFDHFYNLEYDDAIRDFSDAIEANPGDLSARNHVAQAIMFRVMFRSGALESEMVTRTNPFLRRARMEASEEERRDFHEQIDYVLAAAKARIAADPMDIDAHYAAGVAHGLRANWNFLVRKAWIDALKDATAARKAHERVTKLDPSRIDGRLTEGLHDYVVGSLPWTMKVLGFIAGFRGDKEEGIKTLQLVAEKGDKNTVDAQFLLATVYRREGRALEAIALLKPMIARFPRNYLLRFELAQMYSDAGERNQALAVLDTIEGLHRRQAAGYRELAIEKVYFARGVVQFWYRDLDSAERNLRLVTAKAEDLDLNTALMAWMRLGQTYDLLGRREDAISAYRAGAALAPESQIAKDCREYLRKPYRRSG